MKKFINALLVFTITSFTLVGCSGANSGDVKQLKVVATAIPHAEILEHIKPDLQKQGIELEIIETSDYQVPNRSVNEKEADANFFQHYPFFESQVNDFGYELEVLENIHIEPLGLYSQTISSIDELPEGATISIPNDESNEARALILLDKNNIIKLDDPSNLKATPLNIVNNPKDIKFTEIDAAMLPRSLQDVDASIINSNYAMEADLSPTSDALIMEAPDDNPYVNIVVVRKDESPRKELQALKEAITSAKVKEFIEQQYGGAVVPAF